MRSILFITRSTRGTGGMQTYTRTLLTGFRTDPSVDLHVCAWRGPVVLLPVFFAYAFFRALIFRGNVCHIGDALLSPIALCIRVFRPRLRCTLTTYGLDVIYPSRVYQWMLRLSLPCFDVIATISHATLLELTKRAVNEDRIVVITPGIDVPSFILHSDRPRDQLLLLGRQIKRKGAVWFLSEVMPLLLAHYPSMHLTIAGDGPELPAIRVLADSPRLHDHVSVLGDVDEETKKSLLQTSTLFLMPNIDVRGDIEGFGLVCTEALAYGLPVVASRREGIIDAVLEGVTGLFFAPQDPESAVQAMTEALTFPWDQSAMRRTLLERYSSEMMCSRYLSDVF